MLLLVVGMVREIRWVIFFLLLPLVSGARHWLQEHLLWRNGAECHKTSSSAEKTWKESSGQLSSRNTSAAKENVHEQIRGWIFTEQIQRCAWGMTGIWHCIIFLEGERKHPYAGTWERVSVETKNTWKKITFSTSVLSKDFDKHSLVQAAEFINVNYKFTLGN